MKQYGLVYFSDVFNFLFQNFSKIDIVYQFISSN